MVESTTMQRGIVEYKIIHGKFSRPESGRLSLEALKIPDKKLLGHINLELLAPQERTVKLNKITTLYPIRVVGGGSIDNGGYGIGTMLLLKGMIWAKENDAESVVGNFVPEKDLYAVKGWYEKRGVAVSSDLRYLSGIVSNVIFACRNIANSYK